MKAYINTIKSNWRRAIIGLGLSVVILILDQISKAWVLYDLGLFAAGEGSQIEVLDPWFNLTMVWNRGVSFGLFAAGNTWQIVILIGFSLLISGVLLVWLFSTQKLLQILSFGLIIGGAIGNVIDRVRFGAVVDFLDFSGLYFPFVFNIADSAISIGVAMLLFDTIFNETSQP